jgi:outer membrane protein OmpA-like peptidoglycan-associated protein
MRVKGTPAGALVRFAAIAVAGSLAVSACGGSDDDPDPGPSAPPSGRGGGQGSGAPLQSQVMLQNGKVRVDLMALERVADKAVIARMRVVNQDTGTFTFGSTLSGLAQAPPPEGVPRDVNSVSAISLFDPVNSRRHFPLMETGGRCLCTRYLGLPEVRAGQSFDVVAAFPAPPASVGRLGVLFPNAAPFLGVQAVGKPGATLAVEGGQQIDPTRAQTAPPRILPVSAISENATGVEEDLGADLRVRVSSDVLFALNKADLTPRAQEILKEVAGKIDRSPGNSVKVDGHTDSSGNDAINKPLSERRAQSVQTALQKLVTRQGVTYQAAGYGSADPVASNDSDRGRALNRRVTVSFARPKPATAPSAPAQSGDGKVELKIQGARPPGYAGDWPRNAKVQVGPLRRAGDGYATLSWTVINDDPATLRADAVFNGLSLEEGYYGSAANGVALEAGKVRFRVLRDSQGNGFSSSFATMNPQVSELTQGESLTLTAMFKIPAELSSVTVDVPGFGRAQNVPVR